MIPKKTSRRIRDDLGNGPWFTIDLWNVPKSWGKWRTQNGPTQVLKWLKEETDEVVVKGKETLQDRAREMVWCFSKGQRWAWTSQIILAGHLPDQQSSIQYRKLFDPNPNYSHVWTCVTLLETNIAPQKKSLFGQMRFPFKNGLFFRGGTMLESASVGRVDWSIIAYRRLTCRTRSWADRCGELKLQVWWNVV